MLPHWGSLGRAQAWGTVTLCSTLYPSPTLRLGAGVGAQARLSPGVAVGGGWDWAVGAVGHHGARGGHRCQSRPRQSDMARSGQGDGCCLCCVLFPPFTCRVATLSLQSRLRLPLLSQGYLPIPCRKPPPSSPELTGMGSHLNLPPPICHLSQLPDESAHKTPVCPAAGGAACCFPTGWLRHGTLAPPAEEQGCGPSSLHC